MPPFPEDVLDLAARVVAAARERAVMLVTVESCTSGLLAGALTSVPGASAVFDRGLVTYSNAAKTELAGVSPALIQRHGAVSEAVARAMAEGGADGGPDRIAAAVTGVAGPGGGTPDKPVGLVHFALAGSSGVRIEVRRFGDLGRDRIRLESVRTALGLLLDALTD